MINVIIADDHPLFADGIKALITEGSDQITVVATVKNGEELLKMLELRSVDIALVDINMPGKDGIELTRIIKDNYPNIKVVILSMHGEYKFIASAIEAGASGYLLKNTNWTELSEALEQVQQGKTFYSRDITTTIVEAMTAKTSADHIELSTREIEVLQLICQEMTNEQIGAQLFISTNTVKTHRRNLLQKLKVTNTVGLVKFAYEQGLI